MLLCVLVTLCFTLLSLPFKLGLWPTCVAGAHYHHRHSERLISHLGSDIVDPEDVPCILRFSLIQDMKALRQQPSASRRAAESADADMAAAEAATAAVGDRPVDGLGVANSLSEQRQESWGALGLVLLGLVHLTVNLGLLLAGIPILFAASDNDTPAAVGGGAAAGTTPCYTWSLRCFAVVTLVTLLTTLYFSYRFARELHIAGGQRPRAAHRCGGNGAGAAADAAILADGATSPMASMSLSVRLAFFVAGLTRLERLSILRLRLRCSAAMCCCCNAASKCRADSYSNMGGFVQGCHCAICCPFGCRLCRTIDCPQLQDKHFAFLAGSPKLRCHHVLQADFPHLICAATLLWELSNSSSSRTDDIDDASLRYWTVAALLLSGGNFVYHALGFLLRDTSCGRCCGSGFFTSRSGWLMLSSSTFGSFDRSSALNNLTSSNGSSNGSSNHGSQQRRRGNDAMLGQSLKAMSSEYWHTPDRPRPPPSAPGAARNPSAAATHSLAGESSSLLNAGALDSQFSFSSGLSSSANSSSSTTSSSASKAPHQGRERRGIHRPKPQPRAMPLPPTSDQGESISCVDLLDLVHTVS